MQKSSLLQRIITVSATSGIAAAILVLILFMLIPTAWLFFIIPAAIAFAVSKFVQGTKEEIDENYEALSRTAGLICGGITLGAVILPLILIFILTPLTDFVMLIANIPFILCCCLAVWLGYKKGSEIITDLYYDAHLD